MHSLSNKKWYASIAFAVSMFIMLVLFICLPHEALAAAGTLGTESPEIICTYTNSEGTEVDGNTLEAGTYNVSFVVKGMSGISVAQVTATYTENATFASEPVALLSDADTTFSSEGYVVGDGNLVFGFVSNNADASAVNPEGTILATFSVTFASACDAADAITVSTNPNHTFILADYADGYDDEYALVDSFYGYNGTLYLMASDVTPSVVVGHNVSANLVVMTKANGTTNNVAVNGEYTIDVYSDSARETLVTSVKSVNTTVDEINTNSFVIEGLTDGTYYATISSDYSVTRDDITIVVNGADLAGTNIPVLACDFDSSNTIGAADAIPLYKAASSGSTNMIYDLDGSNTVSAADAIILNSCASGTPSYKPITIE